MPGPTSRASGRADAQTSDDVYAARPWLAAYPDGVPGDYDFPSVPLTRLLDDAAASWPSSTAIAFSGTRLSYRELKDTVDRFATALAGLGVRKGDRVAVVLPNCPQNVITTYAALRLGAVVVQHNPLYTEHELRHQLADSGASVVVCLDRVYAAVARVRHQTALQHVVVTSIVDYLSTAEKLKLRVPLKKTRRARAQITAVVPQGAPVHHFVALLRGAGLPSRQVPLDPQTDLALLQYTGGTTGSSRGVMLTHANLVSNAYMNRLWDTGATPGKEVCLAVLPLFHAYGLTVCMNATLLLGGTLVLLPRFDLDRVFAAIEQWKPTMFPGVPPIYKALSDSPRARTANLRSIRICVSGAMKLPREVQEQFERVTGVRLVEGYGMTETSPCTHCNPTTGLRKVGSIGVPLPGTECKVVDVADSRRTVPVGQSGELAVRGPQVFRGYWGSGDEPAVFTDDGYLLTGDVAVMDQDGFFTLVDRKKELIIAGGFNIYPSEVEEVLLRLPGVADAAVVGVPDRYRGETVKAFVVPAPETSLTEDDVVAHCAAHLTAYKVPKIVEFRQTLPRTEVGKVLRRVLLEEEKARVASPGPRPASEPSGIAARQRAVAEQPPDTVPAPAPSGAGVDEAEQAAVDEVPAKRTAARQAARSGAVAGHALPEQAPAGPAEPVDRTQPVNKATGRKPRRTKAGVTEAATAKAPAAKARTTKAAAAKSPAGKRAAGTSPAGKARSTTPRADKADAAKPPAAKAPPAKSPAAKSPAAKPPAAKPPTAAPRVQPPPLAARAVGPGKRVVTARPSPRKSPPSDQRCDPT